MLDFEIDAEELWKSFKAVVIGKPARLATSLSASLLEGLGIGFVQNSLEQHS